MQANTSPDFDFTFSVMIVGESNTGKTALQKRYQNEKFEDHYLPTAAFDTELMSNKRLKLYQNGIAKKARTILFDLGGKSEPHIDTLLPSTRVILLTVDLSNKESLKKAEEYLESFRKSDKRNDKTEVILVGTKADKDKQITPGMINEFLRKQEKTASYAVKEYIETSAKKGENVDKLFHAATTHAFNNRVKWNDGDIDRKERIREKEGKNKLGNKIIGFFTKHAKKVESKEENLAAIKQKLEVQLTAYINRINVADTASQKKPTSSLLVNPNFKRDFWIMKDSRALNRKANYHLAIKLKEGLQGAQTLEAVSRLFTESNIEATRKSVYQGGKGKMREINSRELNKIIEEARKYSPKTSPDVGQDKNGAQNSRIK